MPQLAVGQPGCGWVDGLGRAGTGAELLAWQQPWERLGHGSRDAPSTFVPGPEFGGTELLSGVMETGLCLQMELLARLSGSGRGLG